MSRIETFPMPDVGEGLTEAEILSWHVAVGDILTVNQVMVEIETAKAAVELPSPFAGRVQALLVQPGVVVDVGTPIISIDTDPDGAPPTDETLTEQTLTDETFTDQTFTDQALTDEPESPAAPPPSSVGVTDGPGAKIGEMTADGRIATLVGYVTAAGSTARRSRRSAGAVVEPLPPNSAVAPKAAPPLRKLAKELGVDLREIIPSRPDGVISRADLQTVARGSVDLAPTTRGAVDRPSGAPDDLPAQAGWERRVPVRGVRRLTAQAMVESAFTAPHVTEFLTVDVTPMMELRDRLRRRPEFAELKLSPLAFAALAVCLAAKRTPEINSVWSEEAGGSPEIVHKEYVNLGIAAATPRGLLVPVIRDADQLDLRGLATALAELTATARAGRTAPSEMSGGTFTVTNVGVLGVDTGTPIINPGESAILALGSIKDAPWVVDGQLAVRKVCQLALSFDHRVIDGQQGSTFLANVGALIADPVLALVF